MGDTITFPKLERHIVCLADFVLFFETNPYSVLWSLTTKQESKLSCRLQECKQNKFPFWAAFSFVNTTISYSYEWCLWAEENSESDGYVRFAWGLGIARFSIWKSWGWAVHAWFSISKDFEMILWVIELEAKGVCLTQMTEPTTKIPAKALESRRNFYGEFDPGSEWTLAACLIHASRTMKLLAC